MLSISITPDSISITLLSSVIELDSPVDEAFAATRPISRCRPATRSGGQEGRGGFFCFAVFRARYKAKGNSFADVPKVIGPSGAQCEKFKRNRRDLSPRLRKAPEEQRAPPPPRTHRGVADLWAVVLSCSLFGCRWASLCNRNGYWVVWICFRLRCQNFL